MNCGPTNINGGNSIGSAIGNNNTSNHSGVGGNSSTMMMQHRRSIDSSNNNNVGGGGNMIDATHSAFGDGYSVRSRSTGSSHNVNGGFGSGGDLHAMSRYHDEPEVDYDAGATELYRRIENKDWDSALSRLEIAPYEAKTWVSRREHVSGNNNNNTTKTRWRLLPLHAVCIFRAPLALIEALIEVYHDGPQMKDDQGMLPVHLACRNGASKGVVLTLLTAFPESIYVKDRKQRTPLTLVEASSSANREAVLLAMRKFQSELDMRQQQHHHQPSAISTSHHSGLEDPPPHMMSMNMNGTPQTNKSGGGGGGGGAQSVHTDLTPASSKMMMPASASMSGGLVVNEVDYENRTTLFRLILKKEWKNAALRAQKYPIEASTWIVTKGFNGNLRFLPLHKACVLQPPIDFINSLIQAYPDGASSKDQDGWLPIHCSCFYGSNEKVISALIKQYPKGIQCKDEEGRLPLHYACLKGASLPVVECLLTHFAKGSMIKDDEGRLPIHHACSKSAPEKVIECLLKASPKGAQSKDDQGRLPLHHACRKNASERVVRTLLRVYPRACQIKDDQEKLPIHYACQASNGSHSNINPSIIGLLLSTYPEGVNVQNGFGYTPLAEIKSSSSPDDPKIEPIIKVLEKFKKEQDKHKVAIPGSNPSTIEQVNVLKDKVEHLEKLLGKVAILGKDTKNDLRKNKDPNDILEKLADNLIELGNRSKTPLKQRPRHATPIKSLFGRGGSGNKDNSNAGNDSGHSRTGRSGSSMRSNKRNSTNRSGSSGRGG